MATTIQSSSLDFASINNNNTSTHTDLINIDKDKGYNISVSKAMESYSDDEDDEKIQIENFNSRKDCVNWMKKQGGKTFLIPSESNLEIMKKRFRSFLKINDLFGPTLEVHPVAHYLLSSKEFNLNNNFFRVGECRTNAFKLDRPAGMGITQSILSSFDACSIIAQNCKSHL